MAAEAAPQQQPRVTKGRGAVLGRQYPPLLAIVVAFLIMILIMPSALNLPQANPSTVLEYAPIPPDDETPPEVSESGALSVLTLGSSGGTGAGNLGVAPQKNKLGTNLRPIGKKCIGAPPRQTEDPMSPPCQAVFDGDNGGRTWRGVTKDEIVVIVYSSSDVIYLNRDGSAPDETETTPGRGTYCEVDAPPGNCQGTENEGIEDHIVMRANRMLSRFFNNRFQTYGRHVRMILHFDSGGVATTEQSRRRDAAEAYSLYKPFAVINQTGFGGFGEAYTDALAARDVLMFASETLPQGDLLRAYAPFVWNFWPDAEHAADMYASYVCMKLAPNPVHHSGNPGENGQQRKFGLLYTTDGTHEELLVARQLIKKRLAGCGLKTGPGGRIVAEATYPNAGSSLGAGDRTNSAENIANFIRRGVTTILHLGGQEVKHSQAAFDNAYFPEWVVMGDGEMDGNGEANRQNKLVWANAFGTSFQLREDDDESTPAWQACKEGNPSATRGECGRLQDLYRGHFMLFQAIQVSGPDLNPAAVDAGFHQIERKKSENAYKAAFYFDPGDYTGVKDAHERWYDPLANNGNGCYRMVRGGQRFPAWTWQGGNDTFNPSDQCSTFSTGVQEDPNEP